MKRYQIIPTEEALCGGVAVFSDVLGGNNSVGALQFFRMCWEETASSEAQMVSCGCARDYSITFPSAKKS